MSQKPAKILLVEDDDDVAEMITDYVERSLHARVTRARTAKEALSLKEQDEPEVVVADVYLPDSTDLSLARKVRRGDTCDVVLMTGHPTLGRALEAMRLGVRDMLPKPFDLHRLGHSVERAVSDRRKRNRERLRYDRLRRVSSRVIKERRVLRERVDLVCRDLVGAYRRLAEKVIAGKSATS